MKSPQLPPGGSPGLRISGVWFPSGRLMGWQAGLGARGSHPLCTPHSSALGVPLRKGEGGSAVSRGSVAFCRLPALTAS